MSNVPTRHESSSWHAAYRADALVKRRVATHGQKLKRLGILDLPRTTRILDVCCGEGEMLDMLQGAGFTSVMGLDVAADPQAIQSLSHKPWRYVAGSATQFPFAKDSFDYILCAHSLHHLWPLAQIKALIENARQALKPGGTLALVDHYDSLQLRLALAVLLSPLAKLTNWSRLFREQHLEEKEQLFGYLNEWPQVHAAMIQAGFASAAYRRDLFFFYYTARK